MNVLILTAKFGLGHYKAAESLKERLISENSNNNVIVLDFFETIFPDLYRTIYGTFNTLVLKCPSVYNFLNLLSPRNNPVPFKNMVVGKINKLLLFNNIDQIISVVPIVSEYISAYKEVTGSRVVLNTLITDIEVHESWINDYTNKYFVPSYETKEYLLGKNIDEEKVVVSGIPVSSRFDFKDYVSNKKRILIMGGGLGLIPNIDKFLSFLDSNLDIETRVIVGNNKKLLKRLSKKYKNIDVIGYTNQVYKYMKEADVLVTKSGGITLFEAVSTGTPMYVIKPFLVQEVGNAKYIEKYKLGRVMWKDDSDFCGSVLDLLNNEVELNAIKENMFNLKNSINSFKFSTILDEVGEL